MTSNNSSSPLGSLLSSPLIRQIGLIILFSPVLGTAVAGMGRFSFETALMATAMLATPAICFVLAWEVLIRILPWMSRYFREVLEGVLGLCAFLVLILCFFSLEATMLMIPVVILIALVAVPRALCAADFQAQPARPAPQGAALICARGATIIGFTVLTVMVPLLFFLSSMRFSSGGCRAGEAKVNLAAIRTAELAYAAEFGRYVPVDPVPAMPPGKKKRELVPEEGSSLWELGWRPEGDVYYVYVVKVNEAKDAFTASAISDKDGDGEFNAWGFVKPAPGQSVGMDGYFGYCKGTGTYNAVTEENDLIETVGPCDEKSGNTVF